MRMTVVALASVALVACSSGENEDLRQWMDGVSKNIKVTIPPVPQVKPYEPEGYDAGNLLDPFKAAKIGSEQKKSGGGGLQPDMDRPRDPLEAYPLESMKYVGVITRKKNSFAIIQVDGSLYQVRVGNYMGQNFGVITKISEYEVTLKELIPDSAGEWIEKESTLMLQGQEGQK